MEWADQLLSKMLGVADWMAVLKSNLQQKEDHKKRYFHGQADHKGEGGSAPSALTVSKCENIDLF